MPPRLRLRAAALRSLSQTPQTITLQNRCYAIATASASSSMATIEPIIPVAPASSPYPPSQPPSYRRPELRKTQLFRQYVSLLRTTPLILIFQHNNVLASEWAAIRRELTDAMRAVDGVEGTNYADEVNLFVIKRAVFGASLRVVEFYNPSNGPESGLSEDDFTHSLSSNAYRSSRSPELQHGLEPLLTGPMAVLTVPTVSPQHLRAALSIVSPSPEFPAPKRRTNPSYHEPAVQNGLPKLMLLGARIEGKAFDVDGARWVGGIAGGLQGLRAQLVAMLQGVGAGVTGALETASKSLYLTMESRRSVLEEDSKPKEEVKEGATDTPA